MNEETRAVLQETRRRLLERGWVPHGGPETSAGSCLAVAAYFACERDGNRAEEALSSLGFLSIWDLFNWNDEQESVEPVIALLDRVLTGEVPLPSPPDVPSPSPTPPPKPERELVPA